MKPFLIAGMFVLGMSAALADDEPLTFKGLPLGATEREVVERYPILDCSGDPARRRCFAFQKYALDKVRRPGEGVDVAFKRLREMMSVAGYAAAYMSFTFYEDKLGLISLTIPAKAFSNVSTAYQDRYGPPTSDRTSTITTRAGAVLENREVTWVRADGTINLARYSSNIDESRIMYVSPAGVEYLNAEEEQRRAKAAKSL